MNGQSALVRLLTFDGRDQLRRILGVSWNLQLIVSADLILLAFGAAGGIASKPS